VRQILQSLKSGTIEVAEVPRPAVLAGRLLVRTTRTLISAGTERMLVEFGRASLLNKALQQPERVKMVLDKIRTDGLLPTLDAVRHKLDEPVPLGYCNVGVVLETGAGVSGFAVGDRVVSNGPHAEVVSVPQNLCARVPDGVPDEQAVFTVLGAVGLQGLRLAEPSLGETVVVTGLGLIGLLTVQLLRAHGCRVLGIDLDPARLAQARRFGAETVDLSAGVEPVAAAQSFSRGRGVDAVLITASTKSDEPVHQAAQMCRQRGRIVLVGVVGLSLARDDFYKKELSFQVSSSYGPGRYDPRYEEKGQDYPVGFVRWTAQRNFEAVLDVMAAGGLDAAPLVSHRIALADAERAYGLLSEPAGTLGIVLEYAGESAGARTVPLATMRAAARRGGTPAVSFIGAGNYATGVLIPAFAVAGARLRIVASADGVTGFLAGRKFGFDETTTDPDVALTDRETRAIAIATRHDSHAGYVLRALAAGKDVFVEKPLCLTLAELAEIEAQYRRVAQGGPAPRLIVGYNRRFAPHVRKMKELLASLPTPKVFVMTVNAGAIPPEDWTQDPAVGGGRLLGEGCHFIDLLRFLAGAPIAGHSVTRMASATGDTATIQLSFADGSVGTVHYFANGSKRFPKERLEVFGAGRVLVLDNFRRLTGFGWPGFGTMRLWRQDKGQKACAAAFVEALRKGLPAPIPFEEIVEVSRVAIVVGAR
jgi:predicted dehydrogenase/threonine dehydrogenase-like Zn-dependent dehydrogenase